MCSLIAAGNSERLLKIVVQKGIENYRWFHIYWINLDT